MLQVFEEGCCISFKVPMKRIFFIILFERAFKMIKNSVHFIVIALLVAELFKILIYANSIACDVTVWTQTGVKSQKIEYLPQLFLYRTET